MTGINPTGDGFAIGDLDVKGRVDVWSCKPVRLFLDGRRIQVPQIEYNFCLLDPVGLTLAEGQNGGRFDQPRSVNQTKVDLETRRITGDSALNFRSQDPNVVILEEIMESETC